MLTPAQLIRMSSRPNADTVSSTARRQDSACETSSANFFDVLANGDSAISRVRPWSSISTAAIFAPAAASARAITRPMPLAAPVTTATRPSRIRDIGSPVNRYSKAYHLEESLTMSVTGAKREVPHVHVVCITGSPLASYRHPLWKAKPSSRSTASRIVSCAKTRRFKCRPTPLAALKKSRTKTRKSVRPWLSKKGKPLVIPA